MDSLLISININKICIVCLKESEEMFLMHETPIQEKEGTNKLPSIFEFLISVTNLQERLEEAPSLICLKCKSEARQFYNFQVKCNRSQNILKSVLILKASTQNESQIDSDVKLKKKIAIKNKERLEEADMTISQKSHRDKEFSCVVCNKSYKSQISLRIHKRIHTEERTKCPKEVNNSTIGNLSISHDGKQPYICNICGKRYRQSGTLTAHTRIHTGQRPFLCSVCGKGFRQASDLRYHTRTHTKEKPYMCNICGKTMRMHGHLVQHLRTHSGEKPFACETCGKKFSSNQRKKRHEIIHTGLKPFVCEVCNKAFNRKSSLQVHEKIHRNERHHLCQFCQKGFIQANALKSHLLSHEKTVFKI